MKNKLLITNTYLKMSMSIKKHKISDTFKKLENSSILGKKSLRRIMGGIDRGDSYKPNKHINH
ncbi:hypothetical protein [Aquimarina litoralis]|uniref:hypothetical protein n=1 Tax=Aquimarina litoralis TaxID=584605 RepID=UPI001C58EDC4|nr:hypothetical protein [Aquimarina litoralis]MBW1294061.1 hypothetical protein [Aquimarina litoralis]